MTRTAQLLAGAALLLLTGACGGGDGTAGPGGPTAQPCTSLPAADPAATLPEGFPALPEQRLHDPARQGATRIVFALVAEEDFVKVRDDVVTRLTDAGYTIVGTDQESVEAEAEFAGRQEGTIKVQPYCQGHVTVRYTFRE